MIEDMQLRGYSARTQEAYARAVRQLAEHCRRSPDKITEEELRKATKHSCGVASLQGTQIETQLDWI
jgi:hypothetical protein